MERRSAKGQLCSGGVRKKQILEWRIVKADFRRADCGELDWREAENFTLISPTMRCLFSIKSGFFE